MLQTRSYTIVIAAQIVLTINNSSVAVSAGALLFVLLYKGSEMAWLGSVVTGVAIAICAVSIVTSE